MPRGAARYNTDPIYRFTFLSSPPHRAVLSILTNYIQAVLKEICVLRAMERNPVQLLDHIILL